MIHAFVSGRAHKAEIWRQRIAKTVAVVAPLIIATVVILLIQQVRTTVALREAEHQEQEQRAVLQSLLSAHQDIETGSRGYIITGNPSFLEPYYTGRRSAAEIWPSLTATEASGQQQRALVEELKRLSAEKLAIVDSTIALRRSGDMAGAEAAVRTGRGKAAMDGIRRTIGALLAYQHTQIVASSTRSEGAISRLRTVTFGLLAALSALLVLAWSALYKLLRSRANALAEVEDLALRQKTIVDSVVDSIVTLNPSGSIESINAATLRMFGYDEGELDRRDFGILFADQPPIGKVAERLREIRRENPGQASWREVLGRRSDGSEFPLEIGVSLTMLNEGLRYVTVIRDITERKRVEQLKSDFVATVSHELRTPLTSIAGALGLLSGGGAGPLGERAERLISIAHNNADRLVRLINDILDIEKIESGKMPFDNRELDLKAAVATSIEEIRSFAAKFDVNVSLSAPMTPMLVTADRDRLTQVLINLLSNASKYSPAGDTVEVMITPNGPFYRVTIADHGPGIPEGFRDRIFGKFAQADSSSSREKGGTGLGLAIVYEIVQRLGGHVSFDSEPGNGTRFHVDLPAVQARTSPRRTPAARPSLLVCGNGAGTTFTGALREAGYAVTFVRKKESAQKALGSRKFDGIIVDMGLGQGAGIEIIRMIRDAGPNAGAPVLALGGEPGKSELDGAAALVLDWLRKPIEVRRLVDSIDAAGARLNTAKPRVLHVEDDRDMQRLVAETLEGHAQVHPAVGVAAARRLLSERKFDLAIVDLALADGSGVELLPELRSERKEPLPVIIFSAQDADPETAGLVDAYLTKARTPIGDLVAIVGNLTARPSEESGR